jgi:hypothetical protein
MEVRYRMALTLGYQQQSDSCSCQVERGHSPHQTKLVRQIDIVHVIHVIFMGGYLLVYYCSCLPVDVDLPVSFESIDRQ